MFICTQLYIRIYTHGFAHPRHCLPGDGSTTWKPTIGVFYPHKLPKIVKSVTKRTPTQEQFTTNHFGAVAWALLGGLECPKDTRSIQKHKNKTGTARNGRSTGTPF